MSTFSRLYLHHVCSHSLGQSKSHGQGQMQVPLSEEQQSLMSKEVD